MRPLQAAREAAGLTPETAAKLVGVTVAYLRSFETSKNKKRPPYVLTDHLARIYGCAIEVFLR